METAEEIADHYKALANEALQRHTGQPPVKLPVSDRVFRWAVRRWWPELAKLIDTKPGAVIALVRINKKLRLADAAARQWRERAISAEGIITYHLPEAMKNAVEKHDDKFNTSLRHYL
jgi:hypothetical protein